MDALKFQKERESKYGEFDEKYKFLRSQYSTDLAAAIAESDSGVQAQLVDRIKLLNAEMSDLVRNFIGQVSAGTDDIDPKTIPQLTEDLIKYQQDYQEIEKSRDKLTTLRMIKNTTKQNFADAQVFFWGLFGMLFFLCGFILYYIFKIKSDSLGDILSQLPQLPQYNNTTGTVAMM